MHILSHRRMHGSFIHYSTALLLMVELKHALQMYQIFMHSHIVLNPALSGNLVHKLNWWCTRNTRQNIWVLSGTATCRIKYELPQLNTDILILLVPHCNCYCKIMLLIWASSLLLSHMKTVERQLSWFFTGLTENAFYFVWLSLCCLYINYTKLHAL